MNRRYLLALCLLAPAVAGAEPLDDAKVLLKKRKYADAVAQLEPLTKADPTGEATYCLAMAFDLSGNAPKAIENYKRVVDGKGKRAPEAERSMKALEAIVNDATAVDRARVDFERAGLESSTRLKEAHERGDRARTTLAERERDVLKTQREREAALADVEDAKRAKKQADQTLATWKRAGLLAPSGEGALLRMLGTVLYAGAGAGVGATVWYGQMAQSATNAISDNDSGMWTARLEHYSIWGEKSAARLPFTVSAGGALYLIGSIVLGFGESAALDPEDRADVTATVESSR